MSKVMIILPVMVYFILLVILILNIEQKSQVIKYSFLTFILTLVLSFFLINELVMDYLLSIIIRYFYFPTFSSILLTLLVTMTIFLYNIFMDNVTDKKRIINYIFSSLIFIGYIELMMPGVDINSYNSLYSLSNLIWLRFISRTFILWMITRLIIKYFQYFGKRG